MKIPTKQQAIDLLAEAERLNPGPWVPHSIYVAQAAAAIAQHHPHLDADVAFILGYLHDIGRRVGVTGMRHVIDGYTFMNAQGFEDMARICITHTFPLMNVGDFNVWAISGIWDCRDEELAFVADFIASTPINDYDRLIQLCDALALPSGCTLMEKRLMDVALRHGIDEYTLPRWRAYLALKEQFSVAIGQSIYHVLPSVIENSFY